MITEERRKYNYHYCRSEVAREGMRKYDNSPRGREKHKRFLQTLKGRYLVYKYNAKNQSRDFTITLEQFQTFWRKPCYYGGCKIETIGLDRIKNHLGYSIKNVVSCCRIHNLMKHRLTQKEFIENCKTVARKFKGVI